MFHEITIYEAKIEKQDEIEALIACPNSIQDAHLSQDCIHPGVVEVTYVKRTHRQADFNAVREGKPPIRLTRWAGKVTYMLHWVLEDGEAHARVSRLGLERFYKRWNRCLITMPKILLGEEIG